jgi:putative hydrolase of the HAD superfamily
MRSTIKLFIFDMGGVVIHNATLVDIIASRLGISGDDFFLGAGSRPGAFSTSPYHQGDVGAIMQGKMDSPLFWERFTGRTGIAVSGDPWYDFFDPAPDEGTQALIARLRAEGHRVVCGTNTMEPHYRKHQERKDYSVFDAVYASHLMGIIKPDAAFWRFIMEKEKAQPDETFFTDDFEENIRAAEQLGIISHLFTSAENLARCIDAKRKMN